VEDLAGEAETDESDVEQRPMTRCWPPRIPTRRGL